MVLPATLNGQLWSYKEFLTGEYQSKTLMTCLNLYMN